LPEHSQSSVRPGSLLAVDWLSFKGHRKLRLLLILMGGLFFSHLNFATAGEAVLSSPSEALQYSTEVLDTLENRPRRSLSASASQRRDYLANKESWVLKPNLTLHKLLDLPSWVSLTVEERVRYETYDRPWIKDTTQGQWSVPIQSVVFGEIRPITNWRFGMEFWDARQWGPSDPNRINNGMVNTLNFTQIYGAMIERHLLDGPADAELKFGQMTMSLGSTRLIGRYAFRNTQQSYVGVQGRFRESGSGDWELTAFATDPMALLPDERDALLANDSVWNRPMTDAHFAGIHLTKQLDDHQHFEAYYYDLARLTPHQRQQTYHTPGLRLYREVQKEGFDYEIESVGQTGISPEIQAQRGPSRSFGALMEHVQIAYAWSHPWRPRLQLEWDYASPSFDPLYGISVIDFGPSGILKLFERNNINSPAWRFLFNPEKDVFVYFVHRLWWLADGRSPVGWSEALLSDPTGRSGSYVGDTVEVAARWDLAYNLSFQAGWQILMKGQFAKTAPGAPTDHGDVNYFYLESQFRL
jgi:hypothetical protein